MRSRIARLTEPRVMAVILMCAGLNAGLGTLVQLFKLPIYLDLCGSLVCVAILGLRPALVSAALGVVLLGVLTVPTYFPYIGTALIVTTSAWAIQRFGYLRGLIPTIFGGLLLGVISAIASAPITAVLFGGASLVGADAFTAFFKATGNNIMTSVLLGGISTDPVDKVLASVVAFSILKSLPRSLQSFRPAEKSADNE